VTVHEEEAQRETFGGAIREGEERPTRDLFPFRFDDPRSRKQHLLGRRGWRLSRLPAGAMVERRRTHLRAAKYVGAGVLTGGSTGRWRLPDLAGPEEAGTFAGVPWNGTLGRRGDSATGRAAPEVPLGGRR
jgi:hypothetical protein